MTDIRTSTTDPLRIDWLDPPARVGLTLAPGVHDLSTAGFRWERDLTADLARLRELGATVLVCLMEDAELVRYQIPGLVEEARAQGLEVLRHPIVDGGVPTELSAIDRLLDTIAEREARGGKIVIHCRGGLGRTGTIAGCHLVHLGHTPANAIAMLHRVRRSLLCPETRGQERFIAAYAHHAAHRPAPARAASKPPEQRWHATPTADVDESVAVARGKREDVEALVRSIEREVAASPETCIRFSARGEATLHAAGRTFAAGRFTTPTIGELRRHVAARGNGGGTGALFVLEGAHALTDIGTLQASAPAGTLFQVASQLDCLEAIGPQIAPIASYFQDSTQGPRAAISAFPGTFLRHYAAPDGHGGRFVQRDERCLNLLADVFDETVASVRSGYLRAQDVRDPAALAEVLERRFEHIRVGMHAGLEVVTGYDWAGPVPAGHPRIAQTFSSAMALGGYSSGDQGACLPAARLLLRAAYVGTLLAGIELGCETIVLTLVGGVAFANPLPAIWDAIFDALDEVTPLATEALRVVVNGRDQVDDATRARVLERGGTLARFSDRGIAITR